MLTLPFNIIMYSILLQAYASNTYTSNFETNTLTDTNSGSGSIAMPFSDVDFAAALLKGFGQVFFV